MIPCNEEEGFAVGEGNVLPLFSELTAAGQ